VMVGAVVVGRVVVRAVMVGGNPVMAYQ
ncbi:MAG: hypothetical protein QOC92_2010, partial [Acidimicrobiaceae bacterium]